MLAILCRHRKGQLDGVREVFVVEGHHIDNRKGFLDMHYLSLVISGVINSKAAMALTKVILFPN